MALQGMAVVCLQQVEGQASAPVAPVLVLVRFPAQAVPVQQLLSAGARAGGEGVIFRRG